MSLDTKVYDELNKLKDSPVKVTVNVDGEDKELTIPEYVVYVVDGVEKTRAANKDLTKQRENWESTEKGFKKTIAEKEVAMADLEKKLEETSGKGKKANEEREEWQRQINTIKDELKTVSEKYESAEKRAKENEEKATKANETASKTSLSNDLITALDKVNIRGTSAEDAVTLVLAKGYARLKQNDSGFYDRSFITVKDGKELSADIASLCKWLAETRPYLVSSSGKPGTGNNHQSGNPAANSTGKRNYLSMIQNKT